MEMSLFDTLSMVTLGVGETEESFLEEVATPTSQSSAGELNASM